MTEATLEHLVAQAVGQRVDLWAREHPALAAVINRSALYEAAAERLREKPEYRRAVQAFGRASDEQALLGELLPLAEASLRALLG